MPKRSILARQSLKETILRTGKPVWPIVQAMDEPSKLPPEELEQVILDSGKASRTGVIIFTAGHLDKENKWGTGPAGIPHSGGGKGVNHDRIQGDLRIGFA